MTLGIPGASSKHVFIGYLAAGILLWFFLKSSEWSSIHFGMQSVAWPLLAAAVVLRLASLLMSSLRWRYLLLPIRNVKLAPILAVSMIGMTVALAISGQSAEFVRPYLLSRRETLNLTAALSTVAVEWLLDLLAILTLFIPALWFLRAAGIGSSGWQVLSSNMTMSILLMAGLAALGTLMLIRRRRINFSCRNLPVRESIREILARQLERFDNGLESVRRPHGMSVLCGYSLAISSLTALSCWVALSAFGLTLPVVSAFIVVGVITVGGLIPTPGAIGGFHALCQLSLVSLFRVDSARTVLPVVGLHAVLYIPGAIIGVLCSFPYWRREQQETLS